MRILVGIACLIGLFLLSSRWHSSRMERLGGVRPLDRTILADEGEPPQPGKGVITIGKPSGARPVFLEPLVPDSHDELGSVSGRTDAGTDGLDDSERGALDDWEMRVRPGDVLSRIVRVHYGRISPDLEQRLARYNKIEDPDKLVVGQVLYLPTEEHLIEKTR